MKILMTSLQ